MPTVNCGAKAELLSMPNVLSVSVPPPTTEKLNGAVALDDNRTVPAVAAELTVTLVVPAVPPKVATAVAGSLVVAG